MERGLDADDDPAAARTMPATRRRRPDYFVCSATLLAEISVSHDALPRTEA
jgi:hypothetical protein